MQKLYCFSRQDFNNYCRDWTSENYPENAAFISICNTVGGSDFLFVDEIEHHFKTETPEIINLDFDDIDEPVSFYCGKKDIGITEEDAMRLAEFIERNQDKNIYVHCEAGLSRSQGVVRYILDIYGKENYETRRENPCRTPNMFVVRMLKRAYCKLKNLDYII